MSQTDDQYSTSPVPDQAATAGNDQPRLPASIRITKWGIEMTLHGSGINRTWLLDTLQACRKGHCECPNGELRKLGVFSVQSREASIVLELSPKPGEHFDPKRFIACAEQLLGLVIQTDATSDQGNGTP